MDPLENTKGRCIFSESKEVSPRRVPWGEVGLGVVGLGVVGL